MKIARSEAAEEQRRAAGYGHAVAITAAAAVVVAVAINGHAGGQRWLRRVFGGSRASGASPERARSA